MKNFIFWTWCFPQTFVGKIIHIVAQFSNSLIHVRNYKNTKVIFIKNKYLKGWSGASLGKYIFVNARYLEAKKTLHWIIRHEYGHTIQNFILGPLYILIILIPSVSLFFTSLINKKYRYRYHKIFPENWANKLAGLKKGPPRN